MPIIKNSVWGVEFVKRYGDNNNASPRICLPLFTRPTRRFIAFTLLGALLALPLGVPVAFAASGSPVCEEPKPGAASNSAVLPCDMTQRDLVVTCDTNNVGQSCPPKPMPMLDTKRKSYIKDYSPYLYHYLSDPNDPTQPYTGTYYRGTPGGKDLAQKEFGNVPPGETRLSTCAAQIKTPSDPTSPEDKAKLIRLQLDNCANQYILNAAIYPFQKADAKLLSNEDPKNPAARISPETECQALNTAPIVEEEYMPSDYMEAAWKKLLNQPSYRKTAGAPDEPRLPDGIELENIDRLGPKLPASFPEVKLATLAASKYEEINDPSHPFSPRWDYKWNERDHYSPKTSSYSGDSKNAVYCAGDKGQNVTKVDVLVFRDEALGFDKKINDRIDFNKNCKANMGMQANPCCTPIITGPNPALWKCKLETCATCYKFSKTSPACATDYVTQPDRKNVLPYVPVPPGMRLAGVGTMLKGMALGSLPANLPVSAVQAALSGQSGLMGALSGNLSIKAALPLLQGQVKILGKLPLGQITQVGGILGSPQNMLGQITALGKGQAQQLLGGQLKIVANLSDVSGKLNVGNAALSLSSASGLLRGLPGASVLGDAKSLMNGQISIISKIPTNLPVRQAISGIRTASGLMNSLPRNLSLSQAGPLIRGQVSTMVGLPRGTTIGRAQTIIQGQVQQFANLPSGMRLGDALGRVNLDPGLVSIRNLSMNTPVGQVRASLTANLNGLSQFAPSGPVGDFTSVLSRQTDAIMKLPGNLPVGEVGAMVQNLDSSVAGLAEKLPISEVNEMLSSQMDAITGLADNLPISDVNAMVDSLQSGLGDLNPGAALSNVQEVLDSQIGGILDMKGIENFSTEQLGSIVGAQNDLVGQIGGVTDAIQGQIGGVTDAIQGQIGGVTDAIQGQIGGVTDAIQGQIGGVTAALESQIGQLTSLADSAIGSTIGDVSGMMGSQLGALSQYSPTAMIGDVAGKIDGQLGAATDKLPVPLNGMLPLLPVLAAAWPPTAKCTPNELGPANDVPMALLCKDLRRPLPMINKLKMRYHNPQKKELDALPEGVPEGLTFKEYFENRMPYPRMWDTGTSIQKNKPSDVKFQEPMDNEGQYTAIVGVGREASLQSSPPASGIPQKDERCLAGGWGGTTNASFAGLTIKLPDPVTSWTELKLYQSRTLRNKRVSCIGRYEKVFKAGSSENMVLARAGAEVPVVYVTSCPKDNPDPTACTYQTLEEYKSKTDANTTTAAKYHQVALPLGWRGYMASKVDDTRFPKFGGGKGGTITGLSKADLGDIVLMPDGTGPANGKPGLAKIGFVSEISTGSGCEEQKNCYVQVYEADNGKWPDSCGTTDNWGEMKIRNMYKPGFMPPNMIAELERIGSTKSCEDTKLSHCELETWDQLEIYRPTSDIRTGN
jgi:hypothetical protein